MSTGLYNLKKNCYNVINRNFNQQNSRELSKIITEQFDNFIELIFQASDEVRSIKISRVYNKINSLFFINLLVFIHEHNNISNTTLSDIMDFVKNFDYNYNDKYDNYTIQCNISKYFDINKKDPKMFWLTSQFDFRYDLYLNYHQFQKASNIDNTINYNDIVKENYKLKSSNHEYIEIIKRYKDDIFRRDEQIQNLQQQIEEINFRHRQTYDELEKIRSNYKNIYERCNYFERLCNTMKGENQPNQKRPRYLEQETEHDVKRYPNVSGSTNRSCVTNSYSQYNSYTQNQNPDQKYYNKALDPRLEIKNYQGHGPSSR